jgi:hypothetical protein
MIRESFWRSLLETFGRAIEIAVWRIFGRFVWRQLVEFILLRRGGVLQGTPLQDDSSSLVAPAALLILPS